MTYHPITIKSTCQDKPIFNLLLNGCIHFRLFQHIPLYFNSSIHIPQRSHEFPFVQFRGQTSQILVANTNSSLIVKLRKHINCLYNIEAPLVGVFFAIDIAWDSQYFGHLAETIIKLVHFIISLFETLRKIFDLKLDFPFV